LRESRWLEIQEGRVVSAARSESTPLLAAAIALLENGVESTVLLTDRHNGEQAVATVAPIASQGAEDLEGVGLLWVTTSDIEQAAVKRVSRLFNLTRAEEQILAQLVGGADVREAAARHQISIHTARNQLKSIFHKTGRHSQAQLLTLVVRMGSLQVPPR
jgi:DNA-binding CsgD family transcriptional regulator